MAFQFFFIFFFWLINDQKWQSNEGGYIIRNLEYLQHVTYFLKICEKLKSDLPQQY